MRTLMSQALYRSIRDTGAENVSAEPHSFKNEIMACALVVITLAAVVLLNQYGYLEYIRAWVGMPQN